MTGGRDNDRHSDNYFKGVNCGCLECSDWQHVPLNNSSREKEVFIWIFGCTDLSESAKIGALALSGSRRIWYKKIWVWMDSYKAMNNFVKHNQSGSGSTDF